MGLDQYVYVINPDPQEPSAELFYWRKHPDLQRFMEQKYYERGGTATEFNTEEVTVDDDVLDSLELAMRTNTLPQNEGGFFFGMSMYEDTEQTWIFLRKARAALAEGKQLIYTSWW